MKRSICLLALILPALAQNGAPPRATSRETESLPAATRTTTPPRTTAPAATPQRTPGRVTDPAIPPGSPSAPPTMSRSSGPKLSIAQQEQFLKAARINDREKLLLGTTGSEKVTMTDGRVTHDAHLQCVDVFKPVFRGRSGTVEKNFRDTYKFNVAAYRLAKMLGLDNMVPPSVEREIDGRLCSVTWWVDDVWMTEADRRDKQIKPPATQDWVDQLNKIRVFDQLIYNTDRNQGNLLITPDWRLWMIDHTRGFRTHATLLKADALGRCDYTLLGALKRLNYASLTKELGPFLRIEEIQGLLARRDAIVRYFDKQVAAKGQDAVLTGIPRSTPHVSVP